MFFIVLIHEGYFFISTLLPFIVQGAWGPLYLAD